MEKLFDLNIEEVLEHWGLEHAIREIIANAIDEQMLTNTRELEIYESQNNIWHIRDYGRGLQYIHFTQNENKEKLDSKNLIGKFGVGLKDALAVFNRHGISVEIHSKFASIYLRMAKKIGFEVETLHAVFNEPRDKNMIGTEFIINKVNSTHINKAKSMFLKFSNIKLLEKTKYGEVYEIAEDEVANIYVNGVKVASEENFMFSYNITNISAQIKKSLNRERSNVGRTAYSSSVKNILRQCKNDSVLLELVIDLENVMLGTNKDESNWIDVASYAAKTLNEKESIVFLTPYERQKLTNQEVEILEESGHRVVFVNENLKNKIGGSVTSFSHIMQKYTNSFEYKFVSYNELNKKEKQTFDTKKIVLDFLKRYKYDHNIPIYISETIRINDFGEATDGVYDNGQIIIKRSTLKKDTFLGVLAHEFAHHISGASDNTRAFENQLTEMLGLLMNEIALENNKEQKQNSNKIFLGNLFRVR